MDQAPTFDPIPDKDEAPVALPRKRGRATLPIAIILVMTGVGLVIAWEAYRLVLAPRVPATAR
jgi:hypothetical protein